MLHTKYNDHYRKRHLVVLILFLTGLFILADSIHAKSFPFRALSIGAPVPDAQFVGYKGEEPVNIHSFAGTPLLIAFWGGDMEAKKKRAVKSLKALQKMTPYLKEKGVTVLIINMQNDPLSVVDEVVTLSGLTLPVYKDISQKAYSSFGLYVLPSLLFVDAEGKVSSGIGYSKDIEQRLRGGVDVMLGLMTPEELESTLNPEIKEIPEEMKLAQRHMKMGIVMKHKEMPDAALREFLAALELNPALHEARIKLGCLYLEQNALDDAIRELETALEGQPDSLEAEICLAKISAEMGEIDEAIADLQALLFRNGRNPELHYTIGTLLSRQSKYEAAAKSYRKAYDLLQHKTLFSE